MRSIEYRCQWDSDDDRMEELFGTRLHYEDCGGGYETDEAYLFKSGDLYRYLEATGCSCWAGEFEGWELSLEELITLASKWVREDYAKAERAMGIWVLEHKEELTRQEN